MKVLTLYVIFFAFLYSCANVPRGKQSTKLKADRGDAKAMLEMSRSYGKGWRDHYYFPDKLPEQMNQMQLYLKKAIDKEYGPAYYSIATCYFRYTPLTNEACPLFYKIKKDATTHYILVANGKKFNPDLEKYEVKDFSEAVKVTLPHQGNGPEWDEVKKVNRLRNLRDHKKNLNIVSLYKEPHFKTDPEKALGFLIAASKLESNELASLTLARAFNPFYMNGALEKVRGSGDKGALHVMASMPKVDPIIIQIKAHFAADTQKAAYWYKRAAESPVGIDQYEYETKRASKEGYKVPFAKELVAMYEAIGNEADIKEQKEFLAYINKKEIAAHNEMMRKRALKRQREQAEADARWARRQAYKKNKKNRSQYGTMGQLARNLKSAGYSGFGDPTTAVSRAMQNASNLRNRVESHNARARQQRSSNNSYSGSSYSSSSSSSYSSRSRRSNVSTKAIKGPDAPKGLSKRRNQVFKMLLDQVQKI